MEAESPILELGKSLCRSWRALVVAESMGGRRPRGVRVHGGAEGEEEGSGRAGGRWSSGGRPGTEIA